MLLAKAVLSSSILGHPRLANANDANDRPTQIMVSLPILQSLDVWKYGLYPGDDPTDPGMHVLFKPGLTLVLGANGLGKSTLVALLYRMLTGPSDISTLLRTARIGTGSLEVATLSSNRRRTFSHRVADSATQSRARLTFEANGTQVSVERSLRDLSLKSFSIGQSGPISGELRYQEEMARLANVPTFSDWILLLRYIVFYFEDRRSLVWDHTAQRQLLRILFLEPDAATRWKSRERAILEADTRVRNLQSTLFREERALAEQELHSKEGRATKDELESLSALQRADVEKLEQTESTLGELETNLENTRLRFLRLEQDRESQYRELEMAKLLAVSARLPQYSESARYILTQLLTDSECLVCGNHAPLASAELQQRIDKSDCVICGSSIDSEEAQLPIEISEARLNSEVEKFFAMEAELDDARQSLTEARQELQDAVTDVQGLRAKIADRGIQINSILAKLPPEESQLLDQQRELAALRGRLNVMRRELSDMRASFDHVIAQATGTVAREAFEVKSFFEDYAREFLFEECSLSWSPRGEQLGQTGPRFDFPAFDLDLGGSDFSTVLRRRDPGDVSESQREFIDLAFRMALVCVAETDGVSSLVIDAPESSLDVVFVDRAARVLGRFGRREAGNRLVVMSNLAAGDLIPKLLREAVIEGDYSERIVDLFEVGVPTAAIRNFGEDYESAKRALLRQVGASD